jgi:hypothetical protein
MIRKVVQPQVPELLANLPFGRIAMLVECFKVAEYAREFVTAATEFLGIHVQLPSEDTCRSWVGWWKD